MHSRRALLYMPGDDRHKIEKATTLGVDCICMDMEDGVARNRKAEARAVIAGAIRDLDFGASERCIRLNGIGSSFEGDDLVAALAARPDTIVLPKVETAGHVGWVSDQIESFELAQGLPAGSLPLLVGVETPRGILNLQEIAGASPRLEAIIFGGEDFAASIGATRTPEAVELLYARQAVVTVCAAYGLQAIDIVTIDFTNPDLVQREAEFGAGLGFSGKQIIHPAQVDPVQAAFTPSDAAIAKAQQLVDLFETHQEEGLGAFALDGRMIDMPLVKSARGVLERARAAGKG